jgi:hypothetical protein
MQQSGSELLIYGLIIGVILLFNYVMQQLARRAREQEEAAARDAPILPAENEMLENIWGRASQALVPETDAMPAPVGRARQHATAAAQARRLATAQQLFRTRHDLRQAIVLMTVLGPCRALEPPESRWSGTEVAPPHAPRSRSSD